MRSLISTAFFLIILGLISAPVIAQTPQYEKCCGTASSQFPFKNNGGSKTQFWYNPGDFTTLPPNGTITEIYFRSQVGGQAGTYIDFTLSLKQPATGTQFSGATGNVFETGLTQVYFNTLESVTGAATAGGWYSFTLTTPFAYNNTLPLVVEVLYTPPFGGVGLDNFGTATTDFKKVYSGTATATTGTPSNSWWQDFGMDIVTVCSSPPTPGLATASDTIICDGDSTELNLVNHSFGTGQTYQWQESSSMSGPWAPVSGALSDPHHKEAPSTPTFYRCVLTCSATSSNSAPIFVDVNPSVTPTVVINGKIDICDGESATFTATPSNGGTSPSYQWRKNAAIVGTNSSTYTDMALNNGDVITCIMNSNANCVTTSSATSNPLPITIKPIPAKPTISQNILELTASPAFAYQWRLDGTNISGAINQTHIAQITGWYSVVALAANGCGSESDSTFIDVIIGIDDQELKKSFQVFPSPFRDELTLQLRSEEDYRIEIRNILGETVLVQNGSGTNTRLNVDGLPSGIYFFSLTVDGETAVKRIVRE